MKTNCEKCGSSDALHVYEDHTYCFSCTDYNKIDSDSYVEKDVEDMFEEIESIEGISSYKSFGIGSRSISTETVNHFNVKMSLTPKGDPFAHYYPYTRNGKIVAYKQRTLPKSFSTVGDFKNVELFGQAQASGGKTLVITEGELDALSVAEAYKIHYNRYFPVVSLPSATGIKTVLDQRDWVRTFESVVLLFDNDEAGQAAVEKVAKIVGAGRVKVGSLKTKDPSDELLEYGAKALMETIWNARPWSPAGIVVGEEVWDKFKERREVESVPYPTCLDGLNNKLKGIRHGEITLFTSGTGSGKSTVIKEIILDLLSKTEDKIGLISLEESVGDTAEKFINMVLQRNALEVNASEAELRSGYMEVFGDERLVLLDHQGSVGDSSLIDKIEYMALMGCKYLVLDHITIAVSEGSEGLSGNEAVDKVMSDLLKIVKKHNVWLGLISHLRKTAGGGKSFEEGKLASIDDIKGSGSIKQISFDIIAFARNLVAESEAERNTIQFTVLKSRFTGLTGDAGSAMYNNKTCRLVKAGEFNADF